MSAQPVLLLHGQPGGARDWDRVVAALGPGVSAHAIYRPGWDGLTAPLDLRGNAEAAATALDRAGVERATIVGHSLGAGVACWLAVLQPERVRALVLVSPCANLAALSGFDRVLASPPVGPVLSGLLCGTVGAALSVPAARRLLARRLGLDPEFLRAGARLLIRPRAWRAFEVEQRALYRDLPALAPHLPEIAAPATIVTGSGDPVVSPASARELAAQIPGAEFVLIDGAGHLLPHQHGDRIARIIAARTGHGGRTETATEPARP